ncbi:YveK family protein [Desulfoscipio geothermicus]|uniref:Capsular polysaccharide biosynthesis protein n=1 Tax=Desulfoscipio geothermicus DSM 3669 TaxID=1121426 RepID=A0A1I6D023_9FIRM|nr:Wzz/FepE/Etk N-terminal domain-containing protein [Desulfoscipio geothermicus]SFQ98710.1 Capsular polysaccharide biosynthesis protein [Desulfoscipio geothermicus DSM 3669]
MSVKPDIEVDLKDILIILKKGLPILFFVPLVCMIITGYISIYYLPPVYRASTTLMVSKIYTLDDKQYMHYEDLLVANQLAKTYSQIAKSRSVCEQVIAENDLQMSPESFSNKILVQAINNTQLISLSVTDADPVLAARLANETAGVFMEKVIGIMQLNNVKIIDFAAVPQSPIKPNVRHNVLSAGILGLLLALAIVFIRKILKQTLENSEEAEQLLDIPVLASIPAIKSSRIISGGGKNAVS